MMECQWLLTWEDDNIGRVSRGNKKLINIQVGGMDEKAVVKEKSNRVSGNKSYLYWAKT